MKPIQLSEDNFFDFAVSSYSNTRCQGISEFKEDLLLIKYIKRLFRKYLEVGTMDRSRMRLALNHLIIFYNVFTIESATRMLFLKLEPELFPILKTFLTHLNYLPAIVHNINGKNIKTKKMKMDKKILQELQSI
jgi:hypothetical protein